MTTPRTLLVAYDLASPSSSKPHIAEAIMSLGEAWARWEDKTSYWPRLGRLHRAGAFAWIAGTALWLAACWGHLWAVGIPAGVWRGLG